MSHEMLLKKYHPKPEGNETSTRFEEMRPEKPSEPEK